MEQKQPGDLTISVIAEEINTGVRKVATGRVRVTKTIEQHEQLVEQDLQREHVEVTRVPINKQVEGPQPVRQEGDTMIVSVVEEEVRIQKIWILKEELHIQKTAVIERNSQTVVLNRDGVKIERLESE